MLKMREREREGGEGEVEMWGKPMIGSGKGSGKERGQLYLSFLRLLWDALTLSFADLIVGIQYVCNAVISSIVPVVSINSHFPGHANTLQMDRTGCFNIPPPPISGLHDTFLPNSNAALLSDSSGGYSQLSCPYNSNDCHGDTDSDNNRQKPVNEYQGKQNPTTSVMTHVGHPSWCATHPCHITLSIQKISENILLCVTRRLVDQLTSTGKGDMLQIIDVAILYLWHCMDGVMMLLLQQWNRLLGIYLQCQVSAPNCRAFS